MKKVFLFLGFTLALIFPALTWAQATCPSKPQELLDYVSNHFKLQRGATIKSQVLYHDVEHNVTLNYGRVSSAGKVTLQLPDPLPPLGIFPKLIFEQFVGIDEKGSPEDRVAREFTEENYNFSYEGEQNGLVKFKMTPKSPLKGRLKSGEMLLDPKSCAVTQVEGQMITDNWKLPNLKVRAEFSEVKGVYVAKETTFDYSPRWGIEKGESTLTGTTNPDDVTPPPALVKAEENSPEAGKSAENTTQSRSRTD